MLRCLRTQRMDRDFPRRGALEALRADPRDPTPPPIAALGAAEAIGPAPTLGRKALRHGQGRPTPKSGRPVRDIGRTVLRFLRALRSGGGFAPRGGLGPAAATSRPIPGLVGTEGFNARPPRFLGGGRRFGNRVGRRSNNGSKFAGVAAPFYEGPRRRGPATKAIWTSH